MGFRDAVIKENPVLSGILQNGGRGGSQGPPVPDSFHLGKSGNPDRDIRIWNKRIKGF